MTPALELHGVARIYRQGKSELEIFRDLNFSTRPGEVTALVGPSGAGKSSLLHIAGLLEAPSAGEVVVAGRNCTALNDAARTRIRRFGIGFVYQFHHLLPEFSAVDNVTIPQLIAGASREDAASRSRLLLERLGLRERLEHWPSELSGGEQQRVAIARALANKPMLLLADEPTGNLDPRTAEEVHREFLQLIEAEGLAVVIATHNSELASRMHRIVRLEDGRLVEERAVSQGA
jgi:lipoprotein-releasing system ATP-binding protein